MIQAVACFQKASEPTAAGIMSEPSKRKTVFGSCRIDADSLSIGLARFAASRPLLALIQPPPVTSELILALLLAHVSVDR